MAVLSGPHLRTAVQLALTPPPAPSSIGAVTVDLTMAAQYYLPLPPPYGAMNLAGSWDAIGHWLHVARGEPMLLPEHGLLTLLPGMLALVETAETVAIPVDTVGRVDAIGAFAVFGLTTTPLARMMVPGQSDPVRLILGNAGAAPLQLAAGQRICTLAFERITSRAAAPEPS